ncbi:hypothetical protein ACQ4PT_044861 [Festuca glaucescens]
MASTCLLQQSAATTLHSSPVEQPSPGKPHHRVTPMDGTTPENNALDDLADVGTEETENTSPNCEKTEINSPTSEETEDTVSLDTSLATVHQNAYYKDPYAHEFCIKTDEQLASVEARVLPPPKEDCLLCSCSTPRHAHTGRAHHLLDHGRLLPPPPPLLLDAAPRPHRPRAPSSTATADAASAPSPRAHHLLDEMPRVNAVSVNLLIDAYSRDGHPYAYLETINSRVGLRCLWLRPTGSRTWSRSSAGSLREGKAVKALAVLELARHHVRQVRRGGCLTP